MSPIFVAIDTPDLDRAKAHRAKRSAAMSAGSSSASNSSRRTGPTGCGGSRSLGLPIFLDLKLHDIPNTVAKAVAGAAPARARDPDRPCRRRPGDDGGRQGGGAAGHESGRGHRADQPRRGRSRRDRRAGDPPATRSCGCPRSPARPDSTAIVCSGAEVAAARKALAGRLLRRARRPPGRTPTSATRSGW